MNELEQIALGHLVQAWNAFLRLPTEHADDVTEFRHGIHALQVMIMARPARRQLNNHEIAAAAQGEAAAPSADRVSLTDGSDVANAGGKNVDGSAERATGRGNKTSCLASGLEAGIDHSFVDWNASGPDDKRAPIQSDGDAIAAVKVQGRLANTIGVEPSLSVQSPRKAAEAVPERAAIPVATIATIADAIAPASESAKSAGEGYGYATVLPTNSKPYLLRPHCRKPGAEDCGGHGSTHCHSCTVAMGEAA